MDRPKIKSIVAQLPAQDFEESKRFYVETLECTLMSEYHDLLIFIWDNAEIHLFKCDDKYIAENSSVYVRVDEIDLLFEHYQKKLFGKIQIGNKPWGMREFYIHDPSGNLFKFGQRIG